MIIDDLKDELVKNIYGLGHKKALPIAEYVLFSTLAMLRGRNKNPVIDNAGSMSVKYFQELFNVNRCHLNFITFKALVGRRAQL